MRRGAFTTWFAGLALLAAVACSGSSTSATTSASPTAPAATDDTDDLVRIDPRSHRVVATLKVGKSQRQGRLVTRNGRVWILNSTAAGSSLVGVDAATGKADAPIPLGMLAVELAGDGKLIWAVGSVIGQVVGVDPQQHKVVRRVDGLAD